MVVVLVGRGRGRASRTISVEDVEDKVLDCDVIGGAVNENNYVPRPRCTWGDGTRFKPRIEGLVDEL